MTEQEHKERHKGLHEMFDELVVDFLLHNRDKLLSRTSILELMEWSDKQTKNPDDYKEESA